MQNAGKGGWVIIIRDILQCPHIGEVGEYLLIQRTSSCTFHS